MRTKKKPAKKAKAKKRNRASFTVKQQRFIDFYNGNATEAATEAGYSKKTAPFIGAENLKKPQILEAIWNREKKRSSKKIADREERQGFWSSVFRGELTTKAILGSGEDRKEVDVQPTWADRLRASELLGKSEADFTDKTILEPGDALTALMGHIAGQGPPKPVGDDG